MGKPDYDFCGWATKFNTKCTDGRTILDGAFAHQDGMQVPLVYMHKHDNPMNNLGYAILENRPGEGVYAYGYLNGTPQGTNMKAQLVHGDIKSMSIWANQLQETNRNVRHGDIKELSLVLAGANPGAKIESVIAHSDEFGEIYGEGVIHSELSNTIEKISGVEEVKPEDAVQAEEKPVSKEEPAKEAEEEFTPEELQKIFENWPNEVQDAVMQLADLALSDDGTVEEKKPEPAAAHEGMQGEGKTIGEVLDTLPPREYKAAQLIIAAVIASKELSDNNAAEGENNMKHNCFENGATENSNVISHADQMTIIEDAKSLGSLRKALAAHNLSGFTSANDETDGVLAHSNITNIGYLFPEAKSLQNIPPFVKEADQWVDTIINGATKYPFSNVKTKYADDLGADNRAKGYKQGDEKDPGNIEIYQRVTEPQTIYKYEEIDYNDEVDITDFDVVAWLKADMQKLWKKQLAGAIVFGDRRNPGSKYKISPDHIRPILTDNEAYTAHKVIVFNSALSDNAKAKLIVREAIKSRKLLKGSGKPIFITSEDVLTELLLIEDTNGRVIYETEDKLKTALRVTDIVTIPMAAGFTRTVDGVSRDFIGIFVNMADYAIGTNKGGQAKMIEDFDIKFNEHQLLYEGRCSGALVLPNSALALEGVYDTALNLTVEPTTGTTTRYGKTVSDLQSGILMGEDHIEGTLKYVTGYTGYSGVEAEQSGNYFAFDMSATDGATITVEYNGRSVDATSDGYCVLRLVNKNAKLKVTATKSGVSVTKEYSLRTLKLESN